MVRTDSPPPHSMQPNYHRRVFWIGPGAVGGGARAAPAGFVGGGQEAGGGWAAWFGQPEEATWGNDLLHEVEERCDIPRLVENVRREHDRDTVANEREEVVTGLAPVELDCLRLALGDPQAVVAAEQ